MVPSQAGGEGSAASVESVESAVELAVELAICCSDFSMTASVTAEAEGGGDGRGGSCGEGARSSPVLRTEESIRKVAFCDWVKRLVRAGVDSSHGSGGW